MDSLFAMFDQFISINLTHFPPQQQAYIMESWEQFLGLLQTQPLDYGKIYALINKMNQEETKNDRHDRQNSTQRQVTRNLTAASSPRIISSVQKNSTNVLQKFSQLDNVQSPKIAISNLASQQQLLHKASLQQNIKTQVVNQNKQLPEEFNRHLLLSKIKELNFNLQVSTDKLYAIARMTHFKDNSSKSPIKYPIGYGNKTRGSNHSAEHYKALV